MYILVDMGMLREISVFLSFKKSFLCFLVYLNFVHWMSSSSHLFRDFINAGIFIVVEVPKKHEKLFDAF